MLRVAQLERGKDKKERERDLEGNVWSLPAKLRVIFSFFLGLVGISRLRLVQVGGEGTEIDACTTLGLVNCSGEHHKKSFFCGSISIKKSGESGICESWIYVM